MEIFQQLMASAASCRLEGFASHSVSHFTDPFLFSRHHNSLKYFIFSPCDQRQIKINFGNFGNDRKQVHHNSPKCDPSEKLALNLIFVIISKVIV
jgi:hypothetical protein